jgi:hypothetical protein
MESLIETKNKHKKNIYKKAELVEAQTKHLFRKCPFGPLKTSSPSKSCNL